MRIVQTYSHLNGLEFLQVHQPEMWTELCSVIEGVDGESCKTKVGKEKTNQGKLLYSPIEMNRRIRQGLKRQKWEESRVGYWVTHDYKLIRKTLTFTPAEQKKEIQKAGLKPIFSYNQTDFLKNRIAVEIQFGKYSFVAYDLFVKHLAFYIDDVIDVGIEVLPMKELQEQMSSGPAYYEGELYNLIREGRGNPGVPLVLVGIAV